MPEENQNVWKRFNARQSSLRDWANSMVWLQNNARQQQMDEFNVQKDNEIMNNYSAGLRATDHGVSQDCNTATKIWLVAQWIRKYFAQPENWWIDYSNVEDVQLVDAYKAENPDSEEAIWQFVLDDSQVCDPNPLYEQMGFYFGEDESEEKNSNILADIAGWVTESILWLPKMAWNLWADIAAESIKLFWWDEERANAAADEIKSYIDKISFGDENSRWYKAPKTTSDLVLAYLMWKWLIPQTSIWNLWWGTKAILWGLQWAADMTLYDAISDQELPSKWDLNLWFSLGSVFPLIWPAYKWFKNVIKKTGKDEIERAIPKVSKLTETRQDKFLKEFWQTFEEWMGERNLTTYDDVKNYFNASKNAKLEALKQIKWTYKSSEVDDVLDWCVDYAQKTKDPRLEEFLELQTKNADWGLEMWESEKVKQYFWDKWVFNFDWTKTSEEVDTLTNMYEKIMNWQRKVAKENWFWNLAEINNEIQAGWYLNKYIRDMTKIWKKWMSLLDFLIAASTWNRKAAATYIFSKRIIWWAKANEKYANLLQRLFKNWKADKLAVDYEKIQSIQDEKELMKWIEENWWITDAALPNIEWATNDAGKTILQWWETIIWTPEWKSVIKWEVTEIPR